MSKFLTPPVWYDKNGEENQSLVNYANDGVGGPTNIAFGLDAKSGTDNDSHSCIAIGYQATATGRSAIAIGSYDSNGNPAIGPSTGVSALGSGTIVIGGGAIASDGSIAIGDQANANISDSIAIGSNATAGSHQIQLGANNNLFNLTVGNGMGTINGVNLSDVFMKVGNVPMAKFANVAYELKANSFSTNDDSNNVTITGLSITNPIYLILVRAYFKRGYIVYNEFTGSVIINQAYSDFTKFYGNISAGDNDGQIQLSFPCYTKTSDTGGTLNMYTCSYSNGVIAESPENMHIRTAYVISLKQ